MPGTILLFLLGGLARRKREAHARKGEKGGVSEKIKKKAGESDSKARGITRRERSARSQNAEAEQLGERVSRRLKCSGPHLESLRRWSEPYLFGAQVCEKRKKYDLILLSEFDSTWLKPRSLS